MDKFWKYVMLVVSIGMFTLSFHVLVIHAESNPNNRAARGGFPAIRDDCPKRSVVISRTLFHARP